MIISLVRSVTSPCVYRARAGSRPGAAVDTELPDRPRWTCSSAISYVRTRSECDPGRLDLFALGGLARGNAILVAREDPRVKAICAQSIASDGEPWFRDMRREYEWVSFRQRVEANRTRRVTENIDELVDPREELMVASPERRTAGVRSADDARVGGDFHFASAEALLRFRPIESVEPISPCALLMTAVKSDVVTPEYHATALYERARPPKKLVRQTNVTHHESYFTNYPLLIEQSLDWYRRYLPRAADCARGGFGRGNRRDTLTLLVSGRSGVPRRCRRALRRRCR